MPGRSLAGILAVRPNLAPHRAVNQALRAARLTHERLPSTPIVPGNP
jgi:hypothetical protein